MNRKLLNTYRRFRAAGMGGVVGRDAKNCLDAARTMLLWERLEGAGMVRLETGTDDHYDWDDKWERKKYGDEGAWSVIGQFKVGDTWVTGDSVWGFVGYRDLTSPTENSYVIEIMAATIDALRATLKSRCPHCRKAA